MNRRQAEDAASMHRGNFGDDVVLHDPEDHGDAFLCEDCGWGVVFVADDDEGWLS